MNVLSCILVCSVTLFLTTPLAAQQPQPPTPPPPPAEEETQPAYEEQVVVTASKVEQQLVNAPATVSVVTSDVITSSPATNYAELLRSVPGVNISQTSARDFNITLRGATSTLSTSQLALVDGRSLYLDFFGFVAWDLLPMNPNEIRQIEVIRGPASAVWGANALNGVVNFISKTPRELNGNSATISLGTFDRSVNDNDADAGSMFSINGTHARAVNDRWAYKVSAGAFTSDAFARPTGLIPGKTTPYPAFENKGTKQPKFDTRVDYDAPGGRYKLVFAGGYAGTEGIIHTGIGPFDMDGGVGLGYATMRYSRNALRVNFFTNLLNGDATALLSFGTNGRPIPFAFNTRTFDFEVGNASTIGTRQVLSYGGNARYNKFDLSIAPRGDNRTEFGAYVQDEIFLTNYLRLNVGARVDKFDVIDEAVFSPRVALILKPLPDHAIRLSYNKAFRSPSLINNYLDVTIINQLVLSQINPAFAPLGVFNFPVVATGQRRPPRRINRGVGTRLHRRDRQSRDAVSRPLLDQEQRRDLLHPNGPLPGALATAGIHAGAADSAAVYRAGHSRGAATGLPVAGRVLHYGRVAIGVQLSQPRDESQPWLRAGVGWRSQSRAECLRQLLLPGAAGPGVRYFRSQSAAEQPVQHRLQLQQRPLPRQHVRELCRRRVLSGRVGLALPRTDRGLHPGQWRARLALDGRQDHHDDQGDQPGQRRDSVTCLWRHRQAPGDG
ncbi:MAG TPA: TonB-dependent receptor [Vicinamibacterales bacterium]|nr:TonB-dependent receptor [Vicinamibacterales bacterium]